MPLIGGSALPSCSCSLAAPTPCTSTVLLTAGGTRGVKSPPLRRQPLPLLGLHRPHRASPPCRAASTYTQPELPEEAKENTERGAEAAAEHYIATLSYAWNTGDTQSLSSLTAEGVPFADGQIEAINGLYSSGWAYGNESKVTKIVKVEPVTEELGVQPNTIGTLFHVTTINGVSCKGQRIVISDNEYTVSFALYMTWQNERWLVTDGHIPHENGK